MLAESPISGIVAKLSLGINRTLDSATIGADGRVEFWKAYFRQRIVELMVADKKRKQLLNRLKKREKNGIAKPVVVKPLAMKTGERNKFTNKNGMVLLAIEKTILALADDQAGLDDRLVRDGLVLSIKSQSAQRLSASQGDAGLGETSSAVAASNNSSDINLSQQLSENLKKRYNSFFPANNSQTTEVWVDGMRAIYTSVCAVSDFAPSESSYLESARQFLAKVQDG